ncbi:Crp/Fnr family transcriptional regulator [Roseibium litorale]|uniref:Crp/Fnr family transcriptional regulator n=1 Tax=Roseibium litorale TaxID=2803841 RepID=A0ABR9CTF0_9HYPH|nr:Crp/Fnr family transcriptional regulator [Roseibium litorale]MBD8893561.1 Crp/Fnr family transcriptional regulator [Roseibium litorale]
MVCEAGILDRLGLDDISESEKAMLARSVQRISLPEGAVLFSPGSACTGWILLEEGSVRVFMTSSTGREIMLYRVSAGESCVLTTSCLLGDELYSATGVTEAATRALLVPAGAVMELIGRSGSFRRTVFQGFGHRIAEILHKMEEAVFHPIDARLAALLLDRADEGREVKATQAELAADLGSAREVVSRQLGKWSEQGLLERARGSIHLLKTDRLRQIAGSCP